MSAPNAPAAEANAEPPAWMFWLGALAVGGGAFAYLVFGLGLAPDAPTLAMSSTVVVLMVALRQLFRVVYALGFESAELWADAAAAKGGAVQERRGEYKRVLRAIKQLDEDHELGKLGEADHKKLREDLTLRAVELKRELKGEDGGGPVHPALQASLEAPASASCAKCETVNDPDARFCKSCGAELGEASGDSVSAKEGETA